MADDKDSQVTDNTVEAKTGVVPKEYHDLFDRKAFAVMTTLLPDGQLHGTVVWVDFDGTHLLVNSAEGRRKVKNVRQDPQTALVVIDPESAYRYLWVTGSVVEITDEGADEHIEKLAKRYLDVDEYPYHSDVSRLILKIRPEICRGFASQVIDDFDM